MSAKYLVSHVLLLVLVFQALGSSASARMSENDERVEIKVSETERLRQLLENQKVNAVLVDGTRIRGTVKGVTSGTLTIRVASSDGASATPRGDQTIDTARFSTLEITKFKGKKRGILAAALGAGGFLLGVAVTAMEIDSLGGEGSINGAGVGVLVAATAGGAAAGYALGRNLDKKKVTVVIAK